jgi:alanine dehydrogenase
MLTDFDVRSLLDPGEVMDAVEHAFRTSYGSTAIMPVRSRMEVPGGVLLTMPCFDSSLPALGAKLVTFLANAPQRVRANYVLLDPADGSLKALMEANHLTDLRTAATSAIATRLMTRRDAQVLGIFGTGRQARAHLEVLPSVRPFKRFLVCGSNPQRSREFAATMSKELRLQIEPADARACASQADIICTCTTAGKPVLEGRWLRPGTHLNLVGSFAPSTREVDSETMRRARIAVETYEGALAEAGDVMLPMREGVITRESIVADLHELTSGKKQGRTSEDEITVFKNLGCALEDLVTAALVWKKAARLSQYRA